MTIHSYSFQPPLLGGQVWAWRFMAGLRQVLIEAGGLSETHVDNLVRAGLDWAKILEMSPMDQFVARAVDLSIKIEMAMLMVSDSNCRLTDILGFGNLFDDEMMWLQAIKPAALKTTWKNPLGELAIAKPWVLRTPEMARQIMVQGGGIHDGKAVALLTHAYNWPVQQTLKAQDRILSRMVGLVMDIEQLILAAVGKSPIPAQGEFDTFHQRLDWLFELNAAMLEIGEKRGSMAENVALAQTLVQRKVREEDLRCYESYVVQAFRGKAARPAPAPGALFQSPPYPIH